MPRQVKCPTCRKQTQWDDSPHRPFCSERCRLLDLGAWAQERYRIPAEDIEIELDNKDEGDNKEPIN